MSKIFCIIVTVLIFSTNIFAQEKSVHGFCFKEQVSDGEIKQYVHAISLPNDQLDMMGPCLEVLVTDARAQLYETFLQRNYRLSRTYKGAGSTSAQMRNTGEVSGNCTINLLKKQNKDRTQNDVSLGKKNILKQSHESSTGNSTSQLVVGKGLPGSLQIGSEEVFVTCNGGNNGNFRLAIALKSPNSGISTSVEVASGQSLNIGSIVKDLSGKDQTLSVDSGIRYQDSQGKENAEYFLTIQ